MCVGVGVFVRVHCMRIRISLLQSYISMQLLLHQTTDYVLVLRVIINTLIDYVHHYMCEDIGLYV